MKDDLNNQATPVSAALPASARAQDPPPPGLRTRVQKHQRSALACLRRHRRAVLGCLGGALLLGGLAQLLLPRTFESRAQIYVLEPASPAAVARLTGPAGKPSTHAARLATTPVLQAALASDAVRGLPSFARQGDAAIERLRANLHTSVPAGGETVDIRYRSRSAQNAATVLTAVIEAYRAQLKADRGLRIADPVDPSAPRIMDEQMMAERLSELAGRLARAEGDAQQAAARLTQADAAGDDAFALAMLVDGSGADSQRLGAAELAYLSTELKKLNQQLESMPASWGPEHAIRGPIQRRVDAMRHEVNTRNDQVAHALRMALERSHAAAEQHARDLAHAFEATQAAAARAARPPIRVIQWPEVPRQAVAPKASRTLGIAALGGLGLALALVLRRELRDLAQDAPAYTPLSTEPRYALGHDQASPAAPRALLGTDSVEAFGARQGAPLLGQMPEVPRALAGGGGTPKLDDPAASIHQIRAVLQVQATATGMRAFAFTSPRRGAGKTSVALGVASSLALSGSRTLVVDCDLASRIARNRAAHPGGGPGADLTLMVDADSIPADLSDARADRDQVGRRPDTGQPLGITGMIDGQRLSDCVVATTTRGLSLLPAVNPQPRHISKISDAFIRRVIDESRHNYDLVLFDSGPVPGSVEALLVASQCDGVVVVVPQGEDRKALDRTMSYLKVVGARVTGTVFNRVKEQSGAEGAAGAETADGKSADGNAAGTERTRTRSVPLGSGILAAAVFSDVSPDPDPHDDLLRAPDGGLDDVSDGVSEPSNDVDSELADVFGAMTGDDPTSPG